MDKRLISRILVFGGVALVILSVIMLMVSAAYVENIEDALDVDMNGSDVKHMLAYMENLYDETDADKELDFSSFVTAQTMSSSLLNNLDGLFFGDYDADYTPVNYTGFGRFALYARSWMFWLGVIAVIAGATLCAAERDAQLVAGFKELARRYGAEAVAGIAALLNIKAITARFKPMARPSGRAKLRCICPGCGAAYDEGAAFCGKCGARLPAAGEGRDE